MGFYNSKGKKIFYNKVKTGKADKTSSPVCVSSAATGEKKTTPKKKPAPKFAMAGNGKATCSGKGAAVKSVNACKAAAKAIKKQFGSSGAFGSYPKGCFVYNNKLYFNNGKTGKGNSKASPVCAGKATGGKKTTPKKKPANPCAAKNNGGCAKERKCMNVKGKAKCGNCPKGYTNLGTKYCKKATATKKPQSIAGKKLVLAGNGRASCSGKAAAKAMKKKYASVQNVRYPRFCILLNNKIFYNKGKVGKAHSKASPVCVAKGPFKPKLVLAKAGQTTCGSKLAPVKNEQACKAAAKAMKKPFGGAGTYHPYPKGCHYNAAARRVFYNKGKAGLKNAKASPVCKTKKA